MPVSSRASILLLWQLRGGFRVLCWLATSVGLAMAALATAFRACGRAGAEHSPVVILAQLVLLMAWAPIRLLFLALERGARAVYRVDVHLHRRCSAGV